MTFYLLYLCTIICAVVGQKLSSPKRGLIYIQPEDTSNDNKVWTSQRSDLTWYYNYGAYPTDGLDNEKFDFVPMLWGKPDDSDPLFNKTVKDLIDGGTNINYVLGFNEPDLCDKDGYGGSCLDAKDAAEIWTEQVEPLKKLGVQLGAPAVRSAPEGNDWLAEFFQHCDGGCTTDFLPLHWYGDAAYLPDYISGMQSTYKNISTIWITEFANPDVSLEESQLFYNTSTALFDNTKYISRYSYFGSFRSDASNVGPNAAMLDRGGGLTDIGAWYLGRPATGNLPSSDAMKIRVLGSWTVCALVVSLWLAL